MKTTLPITRADLILAIQKGFHPKWVFFWGHKPNMDGSITKSCFSQWWGGHPFEIDGLRYPTAEHFMMAEKARLFRDEANLSAILTAKSAAAAKKLGRQVTGFNEETWLKHRWEIVVRGNSAKFSQYPELARFLRQTGQRVIVEASPHDSIWGIGLAADHPNAERPQDWMGLNLLGFALMKVREQLAVI
jgi:ribA/ribD-fused uncharacterized protein